jgi:hypothetical protein
VKLKSKIRASEKKADMHRKRWMRIRDNSNTKETPDTPRRKT